MTPSRAPVSPAQCPVCASPEAHAVTVQNQLPVVRCARCRHAYVWPVPSAEFIAGLYQGAYYSGSNGNLGFSDYGALEPARRRMFARHLHRVRPYVRPGRVLDVGAATGDFLKVARALGWEVLAVDPSPARALVREAGIPLVGNTLEDAEVEPHSLDLVTFWDVLEHLPDPVPVLRRARRLLRPGGVIALTVPDAANLLTRVSGARWFGYKLAGEHLQFFTDESLRRALAGAGLEVVVRVPVTWSCTVSYVADRAGLYLGAAGRVLKGALGSFGGLVIDVPLINQFALARSAPGNRQTAP